MDRAVLPGNDFFAYANGAWLKATPIPPDRSSIGAFDVAADLTDERTVALIKTSEGAPEGSESRKIGDFFTAFMDEASIGAKGLKPLRPSLDRIAKIADRRGLSAVLGGTLRADVDVLNAAKMSTHNLFGLWVAQDLNDPSAYRPFLLQGGLGMPSRDYYLDSVAPHGQGAHRLPGAHRCDPAPLCRAGPGGEGREDLRPGERHREIPLEPRGLGDVRKGNNHWRREDFDSRAPGMDWAAYFDAAGLGRQKDFVVWQPSAFTGISALVASEPLETWKEYLTFRAVEHAAEVLPKAFAEENFAFYGRVLDGTPEMMERWRLGVDATNEALGDAVGKLYVQKYFPPSEKSRAQAMVRNILAAFSKRIDALAWMSPSTKAKAKAKLAVLRVGVGYPDKWTDYSALIVKRADAFGNAERSELFQLQLSLHKLGRRVDRDEWVMTPQTVNAVNLPAMNALNFPAAILQPPFFDPGRPEVLDYAAIGSTIGHEISHSFDDQGSLFDDAGRLKDWWTKEDMAHFQASASQLAKQYDAYRPFPDLAVNGKQTLGENIADVAGLAAAYDAYRISLGGQGSPGDGGLHGGPAVLHRLRPELAREVPGTGPPPAGPHQRPRPCRIPRRHGAQSRCLVRRLRRQARPDPLPRSRGPSPHMVSPEHHA